MPDATFCDWVAMPAAHALCNPYMPVSQGTDVNVCCMELPEDPSNRLMWFRRQLSENSHSEKCF